LDVLTKGSFRLLPNATANVVRYAEKEEKFDEVAARAAEIKEVIDGLKKFRQRIIDDTTALAKKIKAPQKKLKASEWYPFSVRISTVRQLTCTASNRRRRWRSIRIF